MCRPDRLDRQVTPCELLGFYRLAEGFRKNKIKNLIMQKLENPIPDTRHSSA
jgi:hypothetical protein